MNEGPQPIEYSSIPSPGSLYQVLMRNLTCQDQAQLDISTLSHNALKSEEHS